jgi:hypothetical protein
VLDDNHVHIRAERARCIRRPCREYLLSSPGSLRGLFDGLAITGILQRVRGNLADASYTREMVGIVWLDDREGTFDLYFNRVAYCE